MKYDFLFRSNNQCILDSEEFPSSTKKSTLEFSPILIAYIIGFFTFRGFYAEFPIYLQLKFNLTDHEVVDTWAIIGGVGLFIGGLTRIPAGLISDKIGRINALILAYLMYIVTLLLILMFPITPIYILALSLLRFGINMFAMTGRGIVSKSKRDQGLKNGLLASMDGIASFSGPIVLAYALDHYQPDSIIYITITLIIVDFLVFTIALRLVPFIFKNLHPNDEMDLNLDKFSRQSKLQPREILTQNGIPEILFLFFSLGLVYGLVLAIFSIYGYNVLHINLSILGVIIGSGALIPIIWAPIVGFLYKYVRNEFMRLFSWILLLVGSMFLILSQINNLFFVTGFLLIYAGNSAYFTMEITRMNQDFESQNFSFVFGMASTLMIFASSLATFISPILYKWSPEGNFIASGIISGISFILVLFTTKKWSKARFVNSQLV